FGLTGDDVPAEAVGGLHASALAHPTRVGEVSEDRVDAPTDRGRVVVDEEPVHAMLDQLVEAAVVRGDDRLASGPGLEDGDAEGLIPAEHADVVCTLEEVQEAASRLHDFFDVHGTRATE